MILLTDIHASVNALLKGKYQGYKTYGHEVVEGYDKPSFFVNISPRSISNDSINFQSCAYTIIITFFSGQTGSERSIDNLKKIDEIKTLFGYKLRVCGRFVNVTDFDYEFVGEYTDTLQLSVNIEYYDTVEKDTNNAIANKLSIKVEKR